MYIRKSLGLNLLPFLIYVLLQVLFLNKVPDIMVDEPWYSNTAFNFAAGHGIINTCPGTQGGDIFILYTIFLGTFFKLFGCSLVVARSLSIVGGIAALWGLIETLKLLKIAQKYMLAVSLLFVFSNIYYVIFRSGRPDGLIISFGIWSLYFAIKYSQIEKIKYIFFSALTAIFAIGVHPHGFLFAAVSGIFFIHISLAKKQIKPIWNYSWILFLLLLVLVLSIYLSIGERASDILWQFRERSTIGNNHSILANFSVFFRDYTIGIKRLYIFLFETGILAVSFFFLKREGIYLRALVFSALFVILFSFTFFNPYPLRHFGEFVLLILLILAILFNSPFRKHVKIIYLATAIYFLNSVVGDFYMLVKKSKNESYQELSSVIDKMVPDKATTVSLLEFWFPLKENIMYNSYTRWYKTPYRNVEDLISSNNIQYVVMTDYMVSGKTGTSGRQKPIRTKDQDFFNKINELIKRNGVLEKNLSTGAYGSIQIWRIKN